MCLIDKKQFRIAEKDIPVFKVVYLKTLSPHMRFKLSQINEISTEDEEEPILTKFGNYKFGRGWYHALTTKEDAEEFIEDLQRGMQSNTFKNTLSIVTGYIPEGIRYAMDECGYICARKMILNL